MATRFDWEAEGARLGETLDHHHAIVVLGSDREATAKVALGIGRAQASLRRVAVCDLLDEAPPLQSLVTGDAVHGIVDSFTYGVSLNRIAYEVPGTPGLFIMPTGTEPVDASEIFPNARWRRLASGFREMGALLVLAAPAGAEGIELLTAQTDGAVLVGETVPPRLPVSAVISSVREPAPTMETKDSPVDIEAIEPARRPRRLAALLKGAAAILFFSALGVWFAMRPFGGDEVRARMFSDTTTAAGAVIPGVADSADAARPGAADSLLVMPAVVNVADSARAAAFAVELLAANTQAAAAARVRAAGDDLPAGTYGVAVVDGSEWFKVVAGAFQTRTAADSLLAALRRSGELESGNGSIVEVPLAFLVHDDVQPASVRGLLSAYRDLGQPVYALQQPNGTMNVYSGAFATPAQAAVLMPSLRAAGIPPALVYRTGRLFQ